MAFGLGFNKQKVLVTAEKFVQQGKLQNAISEYEKILKADPKDLTVSNTIGDLYARIGENDKAVQSFKSVGDAYAAQGFTVKAIAMYKKLSKIKTSTECILRLAELYTQQGLFNDARAQYLQVAEDFLKSGQMEQAVRIFQKTLEMDPDNVPMRVRLAEAYIRMDKKQDAWQLLTTAAENLRSRGQLAAADDILKRMLKLDPENNYTLVLRGRAAVEAGDFTAAIDCLSKVPDLDSNAEGLRALFQAYLRSNRFDDATAIASKLANAHDDVSAVFECGAALVEQQQSKQAVQLYNQFADRLLPADSAKLFESLRAVLSCVRDDPPTLEVVLAIFQKGGETTQLTEIYELLAHGYVQAGEHKKAAGYYLKLMQLEPANQIHAQNYQQVTNQTATESGEQKLMSPEEGGALIDELEANAPFIEQRYEDETALAVKAAITDAELFISYNMPAKALDPLMSALPRAPRDLRLNQKLAALHTREGRFAEAAVCCRTLESIYHDADHPDEARRYADLAAKYEQLSGPSKAAPQGTPTETAESDSATTAATAGVQEFEIAAPAPDHFAQEQGLMGFDGSASAAPSGLFFHNAEPSAPAAAAEEFSIAPAEVASAPEAGGETQAVDDWEQDFSIGTPVSAQEQSAGREQGESATQDEVQVSEVQEDGTATELCAEIPAEPAEQTLALPSNWEDSIEEVRFYLGQGMIEQAEQVLAKLEALAPDSPELSVLRVAVESAKQPATEAMAESAAPFDDAGSGEIAEPATAETAGPSARPWPGQPSKFAEPAAELDPLPELDTEPEPEPPTLPAPPPVSARVSMKSGPGTLDEFVADLEASLGNDFLADANGPDAAPMWPVPTSAPQPPIAKPAPQVSPEAPVARAAAASATPNIVSQTSPNAPKVPAQPARAAASAQKFDSAASIDLSSMFGELKHELEHDAATADEDPETHYSLGVAFREMGLLDEAIGELQKVCQSVERGHAFGQIIQTYTWLAQCFIDKGLPEVAARWYDKTLKLPNIDQETRTALHYELASSLEGAGNKPDALSNFLEVYSSNIDYRDVAERIKALKS